MPLAEPLYDQVFVLKWGPAYPFPIFIMITMDPLPIYDWTGFAAIIVYGLCMDLLRSIGSWNM